ncbi:MAG: succinate-semialdehyde dehydrogenase (NADP(+)) [Ponticaulis sp.]|nr:succinate-semialdehyde dehydrogenase (NADP(+)) [Ponticaulis sp.]|tara:strand:- start:17683 stop:19140 length:1458 start_codon:yes stop_codon:yes gene_type:complete
MADDASTNPGLLRTQAYINGNWVDAVSGETFNVDNPANGDLIAELAYCGTDETTAAIEAAEAAQPAWAAKTPKERAKYLRDLFNIMMENQQELARILTLEQGKPLAEAMGEIAYGANYIEWFSEEAKRIYGEVLTQPTGEKRVMTIRQPVGVAALITPWNFPNAMLTRKIAPALAAGCTVVCKPASETPLSALAIAELCDRVGIPPGVVNIVVGNTREIGAELTSNPIVKKLSFTGSTGIGKMLTEQCASTLKRLSMELGGNAPFIIFEDADLDLAVKGVMASKFRNAGQTCVCTNRIMVHESVKDAFVEKLLVATNALRVGNGLDDGVDLGPLVSAKAKKTVDEFVDDAVAKGAKVHEGPATPNGACYSKPLVLTEATRDMRVFSEEIFGPVAPVFTFKTDEEAIQMANDTEFGLASYFYSKDVSRCWKVAEALEYGMVGINEGIISNEMAPFGGVKESGQGREGSHHGLDDYLEIKSLTFGAI